MVGSEAVIGTAPNDVQLYDLIQSWVNVKGESEQTLINATFTQDDSGSVLEYTQLLNDGFVTNPIDGYGWNYFIWAMGINNVINLGHKPSGETHGLIQLDLTPCDLQNDNDDGGFLIVTKYDKELFALHGKFAIAAFGACIPLAVMLAFLRKYLPYTHPVFTMNQEAWFVLHLGFNSIAFGLTVGMFVLSIRGVNQTDGAHFTSAHSVIGLIVVILVTIQVIFAVFRPKKSSRTTSTIHTQQQKQQQTEEEKDGEFVEENNNDSKEDLQESKEENTESKLRVLWQSSHKTIALIVLALGIYQIHSGLTLYHETYESINYVPLFWGIMGSFLGVSLIAILLLVLN